MTDHCDNCRHLQLTKTPDLQVIADCGEMSSRIICGKCRNASSLMQWFQSRQCCPQCGHNQQIPPADDYRSGRIGVVKRGEEICRPSWCQWFEADPVISPAKVTAKKAKKTPQPTLF